MLLADAPSVHCAPVAPFAGAKNLYFSLYADPSAVPEHARDFVSGQIAHARALPSDLPGSIDQLQAWIEERTDIVGQQYRDYLAARGRPPSVAALDGHAVVTGDASLGHLPATRWLAERTPAAPPSCAATAGSASSPRHALASGSRRYPASLATRRLNSCASCRRSRPWPASSGC